MAIKGTTHLNDVQRAECREDVRLGHQTQRDSAGLTFLRTRSSAVYIVLTRMHGIGSITSVMSRFPSRMAATSTFPLTRQASNHGSRPPHHEPGMEEAAVGDGKEMQVVDLPDADPAHVSPMRNLP